MRRWDGLVDRYMEEYAARGLCEERVKIVRRELGRFGLWLKSRRPRPRLEAVDAELIVRYVRERTVFRAKATVSGVMSVLRCAGDWLVRESYWASNPLKWLEGPKLDPFGRSPRRLNQAGIERLWQGAVSGQSPYGRHQWLTILALLYGLGLRRGEIARLNVRDWDTNEGTLLVDGRKTGRQRRLAAAELVYHCLESYLPRRQNHLAALGVLEENALFIGRYGGRLSGPAISRGIHRIARRMEVPLVSLHQFRHTCASDLLEAGARLPEVQRMLGHQAISTTVRYLHLSDPQRRAAVDLHPVNDWLKGAV